MTVDSTTGTAAGIDSDDLARLSTPSPSNGELLLAVAGAVSVPGWVCAFRERPGAVKPERTPNWRGEAYLTGKPLALAKTHNTYFCTAELQPGSTGRLKANFVRLMVLVADDADPDALNRPASYVLRTSPGKYQVGFIIEDSPEARDQASCDAAIKAMIERGLIKADKSGNNLVRYVRLPAGCNTKYEGNPAHELVVWSPELRYSLNDALAAFGVSVAAPAATREHPAQDPDEGHDQWAGGAGKRLDVSEAERLILTGEALHDPAIRLAAHYAWFGLSNDDILQNLRELMWRSTAKGSDRWKARLAELPAAVTSAIAKYGDSYLSKEDFTDVGNVNLLRRLTKGDLRFVPETRTWLSWNEGRWEADKTEVLAFTSARAVAEHYSAKAAKLKIDFRRADPDVAKHLKKQIDALRKWERQCRNRRSLENMLALAAKDQHFTIPLAALDTNPHLLGVQNGVVDLRTGELRPDAREDFVTRRCSVRYNAAAPAPRWEKFIDEVMGLPIDAQRDQATGKVIASTVGRFRPRPKYVNYVKRALGYSITGLTLEHKMFIPYGKHGSNGKNVMADAVSAVLGQYAVPAKPELLMTNKRGDNDANRATPAVVALRGARFVVMSEPRLGCVLDNSVVKALTGNESLPARGNYDRADATLRITWKLWMLANVKPAVDHMEQAVVGRLLMMPFDRQWNRPATVDPDPLLPNAEKDLPAALLAEGEGILAWLVDGAVEYSKVGLDPCLEVQSATVDYFREQEPVSKFLLAYETCPAEKGEQAAVLFTAFQAWRVGRESVGSLAAGTSPMNQTAFSMKLTALGIDKAKSGTVRYGIRLRSDFLDVSKDAEDPTQEVDGRVQHAVI